MKRKLSTQDRRKLRTRNRIKKVAGKRPRLSVFRSSKHIYAQIIDDVQGRTLASASSLDAGFKKGFDGKSAGNIAAAELVGKAIAENAKKAGIEAVVFDRGAYIYHGRVKALADAARDAGLTF